MANKCSGNLITCYGIQKKRLIRCFKQRYLLNVSTDPKKITTFAPPHFENTRSNPRNFYVCCTILTIVYVAPILKSKADIIHIALLLVRDQSLVGFPPCESIDFAMWQLWRILNIDYGKQYRIVTWQQLHSTIISYCNGLTISYLQNVQISESFRKHSFSMLFNEIIEANGVKRFELRGIMVCFHYSTSYDTIPIT